MNDAHLHPVELLQPVAEPPERLRLLGVGEPPDLLGHRLAPVPDEQRRAVGVHRPVHRVDRLDGDEVGHVRTGGVERVSEQVRHGQHGRAVVEPEAVGDHHPGTAARRRLALDDRDVVAPVGEVRGGRQSTEPGADDDDAHQRSRELT